MGKLVTYGMRGKIGYSALFAYRGMKLRVDFSGGSVSAYKVAEATYTTSDPIKQYIIENSKLFKDGAIKILSEIDLGGEEEAESSGANDTSGGKEGHVYPDVTGFQAAKSVLMQKYGVGLEELQNKAELKEKASAIGVSFPNLD